MYECYKLNYPCILTDKPPDKLFIIKKNNKLN